MAEISARDLALDDLIRITEKGVFASAAMAETYAAHASLSGRDRGLYTVLVEGTLEQLIRVDYYLNRVSKTPVRKMKPLIRALLRMSAYQILFLDRIPDHAAVSEALRIANRRGFGKLKGYVNGVLRNLARQKDAILLPERRKEPVHYLSVCYSCPEWIVRKWITRFGAEQTERILKTFPAKKELCFWANPACAAAESLIREMRGGSRDAAYETAAAGSAGNDSTQDPAEDSADEKTIIRPHPDLSGVFLCSRLPQISEMKAFREGAFYIQDFSSILAVLPALHELKKRAECTAQTGPADPGAGEQTLPGPRAVPAAASDERPVRGQVDTGSISLKVIDVCGAPGGKSLFLAAHLPQVHILCRDISAEKTAKITENIRRLHLPNITAQQQDACVLREADIAAADLVIADLPCSGLGVIGRKADMRRRVQEGDIAELARLQQKILQTVSQYVKPGGLLLYSTCTISQEENEDQVVWIRENLPFKSVPLCGLPACVSGSTAVAGYLQILPDTEPYRDGFFLSLFRREATDPGMAEERQE